MSDPRHERLSDLFLQACHLDGAARDAFLDEACRDEDDLRRDVEALLEHDARADVLDQPPPAPPTAHPERIGRYSILSVLGEGGMGIVYRARQENPDRIVALKVIRPGLGTERLIRRFEAEARALALLAHPGIASIYEAGTADTGAGPQPFFAMEFIEGSPIIRAADDRDLDVRRRLALLARVCDAVHHAHQKGVIHRDLKPGNILVNAEGQPKVLDFGVARVTDADTQVTTQRTAVGQLLGTVPYMSPEQVAGDPDAVDIRSDVYALGVIAFELLTGRLPIDVRRKTIAEAARMIRDDTPTPLSGVNSVFRGDVETIIRKALEKDREHRYQSAHELGADLERWLRNEPIIARPLSATYQFRKFARRNRALVGALVALFVVLVAATVTSVVLTVQARHARQAAIDERDAANEARRSLEIARDAATREERKATAVNGFLQALLGAADPFATTLGETGPDTTIGDTLDRAAIWVGSAFPEHPDEEIAARLVVAESFKSLGRYDDALRQIDDARDRLAAVKPPDQLLANQVSRLRSTVLGYLGRWDESIAGHRDALEPLAVLCGTDSREYVLALGELAWALKSGGHREEAEALTRDAIDRARAMPDVDRELLATLQSNLAGLLVARRDYEGARAMYDEALATFREIHDERNPYLASITNNIARLSQVLGDLPAAEDGYRRAAALFERSLGAHPLYADTLNNLAMVLDERGHRDEAIPAFLAALEIYADTVGADTWTYGTTMNNLAFTYYYAGREQDAYDAYETFAQIILRVHGDAFWRLHLTRAYQARCLRALHRLDEAMAIALAAHDAILTCPDVEPRFIEAVVTIIADICHDAGDETGEASWRARLTRKDQ